MKKSKCKKCNRWFAITVIIFRRDTGEIIKDSEEMLMDGKNDREAKIRMKTRLDRAYPFPLFAHEIGEIRELE